MAVTVGELARELHCTSNDVQRAARTLGIAAKTPSYKLKSDDLRRLREHILQARKPPDAAPLPSPPEPGADEHLLPERDVSVRDSVGEVNGQAAAHLFLHEDVLHWIAQDTTEPRLRRRANLVLRHLLAFGRTTIVKAVRGPGRGWRRTPLGGNQGQQFYLWWAPAGAPPVATLPLPADGVLVRAVRHHDETSDPLSPGGLPEHYIELHPKELANEPATYGLAFNSDQREIAGSTSAVRFIKGHPGSGKTTTLWLAASLIEGQRGLYLTCNARLVADAEQYFRSLGPRSLSLSVLTFDRLIAGLLGEDEVPQRGDPAVDAFIRAVRADHWGMLGPWQGRLHELYDELHAHAVGRALPVAWRSLPPSDGPIVERDAYLALRHDVLGKPAARVAATIAEHLRDAGLIEHLFPGPARARRALARLGENPARAARHHADIDCLFIDEVQDLTTVELLVLVRLCRTVGQLQDRPPPTLLAAGDEGQTVQPSDFEWGHLADLTASELGRRKFFELPGNVRSPQNLARLVNASWDLYRQFAKAERPRGQASATIEEAALGRIIYTACRSPDELHDLIAAFDTLPNAALVYPGPRVPAELGLRPEASELVLTSRTAKGLDFQTVGVLGIGRRLHELAALAEGGDSGLAAVRGRMIADAVRVALSRATETLVLVDLLPEPAERYQAHLLCAPIDLMEMEPDELLALLRRDEAEAAELVLEFTNEVEALLGVHPARAYRRALQATKLLGDPISPSAVHDQALWTQAWTLRGIAALLLFRAEPEAEERWGNLVADAMTAFRQAGRTADADAALAIGSLSRPGLELSYVAVQAEKLVSLLPQLERRIDPLAREAIQRWCATQARDLAPEHPMSQMAVVNAVRSAAEHLGDRHPEMHAHREAIIQKMADAAIADHRDRDALALLQTLTERRHDLEGACHERRGDPAAAANSYEQAGDHTAMLRALRRLPDPGQALALAQRLGHDDVRALEWLVHFRELMSSFDPGLAARLTDEERRWVQTLCAETLRPRK
jgi:hypothetical protein